MRQSRAMRAELSMPTPGQCAVMGIVNVTPDSFSDGGLCAEADAAVARGMQLAADGADLIDVGGESTRPGARRVPLELELARVLPVVETLSQQGVAVSVDTMRSEVAVRALELGAVMINDVSGGLADPLMVSTIAEAGASYVAMHWRAHSDSMQQRATYDDVLSEVVDALRRRRDHLISSGVKPDRLVLDPGLGFAKAPHHNWRLLAGLDQFVELGHPVLVGASRKSFLKQVAAPARTDSAPSSRDGVSAAVAVLAAEHGASIVRVHDVLATVEAIAVAEAWTRAIPTEPGTSQTPDR